ncbi:fluoride efflux transporter CrcB [Halocynthiibacter sp. C4]|uniref:fluoride efflux transporter CrcB n=1 Tax=Halocynthiibacter sp. C4 TaxID=2992758 RepID=UPI00237A7665|nr:fluoride efflux transporter CrcB [Halocynthiibacter sp. C4]MDE0588478.1 fluoride efflux transporter CrcB [Halocynthiibacter sp. C4]
MLLTLIYVAVGGAIGAVARFLFGYTSVRAFGESYLLATLPINVVGSFLMGIAFVVLAGREPWVPLLMIGVLGGFTTFSSFSLEALKLYSSGQVGTAALYVVLSVVLSLAGVALGVFIARGLAG